MDWEDIVTVLSRTVDDEDLRTEIYAKLLNFTDLDDAEEAKGIDDVFDDILEDLKENEEELEEEYDYDDE